NTPVPLAETAIYYHLTTVMQKIASLLNHVDDEHTYASMSHKIKTAFNQKFFDPETVQYGTGSQTSNAMPLFFNLADEYIRNDVFSHLMNDVKQNDYHTTTGDVGHRYFLKTLSEYDRNDIIYTMTQKTD